MNKNNTNANVFGDIEADKELEERNDNASCSRNKFDDDVFDVNDYNEAKEVSEEDEIIITGNVNYYDAYGFDGKEVTPDRATARNPSKYLCHLYTEIEIFGASCLGIHTTNGWGQRLWRKGTIEGHLWLVLLRTPTSWFLGGMSIRLGRGAYEKFNSDGTFTKFEARLADYVDKIGYWAWRNIPRIPLNMQFISKQMFPNKIVIWEIAVFLFVCLWNNEFQANQYVNLLTQGTKL
uniref:Uncharacterized protein n=1 Tax=Lactuca sativa TaxID=4236 RepID=A0A9R1XBK2_LACSA|nr:hypothetical protein LSAT_V11C600299000 [Lactuca sativa]